MQTSEINWGDSTIDSRDIIARHEELSSEEELLKSEVEDLKGEIKDLAGDNLSTNDLYMLDRKNDDLTSAKTDLESFYDEYADEFTDLINAIDACEDSPDWLHGETLINDNYFEDYIKDLIEDCYDMPKDYDSGKWPWCHMQMDWSGAAKEAKQDYSEVEISGNTFYIRS